MGCHAVPILNRPDPARPGRHRPAARRIASRVRGIQVDEFGGPEVLRSRDLPSHATPRAGPDRRRGRGINFADTHQAENTYLAPQTLPFIPGAEVVGRTDTGRTRVVALLAGGGGYAEQALAHPSVTFALPDARATT